MDLDSDGAHDCLMVLIGSYTSGSGGDSMLWMVPDSQTGWKVKQSFTLINTPIIVTKDTPEGADAGSKGLIVQQLGGGSKEQYVLLTCHNGQYTSENDGEVLLDINDVQGTAIICNDLIKDRETGNYSTLID